MNRLKRYPKEVRERAVRLVLENQKEHDSQWAAVQSIAAKIGCTDETLRRRVRENERDQGIRPGLSSDERERLKQLERDIRRRRAQLMLLHRRNDLLYRVPLALHLTPSFCSQSLSEITSELDQFLGSPSPA